MELCRPCIGLGCDNVPDLASGIDGAIYSPVDYDFLIQCPEGCYCPPGAFPAPIVILASTIPPVIPPILEPGADITLRLQGCQSLITRTLPAGSSQADITAAAISMQAEWAGQQSICNALQIPGVNCTGSGSTINVCNDAQTICCPGFGPITIAAGLFCDSLVITGLTEAQITAAIATIKSRLNSLAIAQTCPAFNTFCSIVETADGPGGDIQLIVHNQSATLNFDSSSFQLCNAAGVPQNNSAIANIPPLGTAIVISVVGPGTVLPFKVRYQGAIVFDDPHNNAGSVRNVDFFANCGFPPPC